MTNEDIIEDIETHPNGVISDIAYYNKNNKMTNKISNGVVEPGWTRYYDSGKARTISYWEDGMLNDYHSPEGTIFPAWTAFDREGNLTLRAFYSLGVLTREDFPYKE